MVNAKSREGRGYIMVYTVCLSMTLWSVRGRVQRERDETQARRRLAKLTRE